MLMAGASLASVWSGRVLSERGTRVFRSLSMPATPGLGRLGAGELGCDDLRDDVTWHRAAAAPDVVGVESVRGRAAPERPRVVLRMARFPPALGRNPYTALLSRGLAEHGIELVAEPPLTCRWLVSNRRAVDVLHFHWRPNTYYAARKRSHTGSRSKAARTLRSWARVAAFSCRLRLARLLGLGVAWTIHEVYPPDVIVAGRRSAGRIDRVGSGILARHCDLLMAHDAETAEQARAEFVPAGAEVEVVPHGSYVGVYPAGRPRSEVRSTLGLRPDTFTFLCFGALRPDKEIDLLLEAFLATGDPDTALVIAGNVDDERCRPAVVEAAAADPRIKLLLEIVPHERVRELFDAADAFVNARGRAWTPGSLILALSLGVPAVAGALQSNLELLGQGRAGWLFRPCDVGSLREAFDEAAADHGLARAKGRAALEQAMGLPSWSEIGRQTADLMHRRCDRRR